MDFTDDSCCTVGEIFNQYLKELGISEFPCGNGNWRNNLKWDSDLLESKNHIISAELFTIEKLIELSYQKPFHKEIVWSSDAKSLLKEAITYPRKIRLDNIHRKFKSLRIVNKNITTVDDYISKFENLEELILSANKITKLNTKILPQSLRILELCGNKIGDHIDSLCISPPPLQHIGLSHNSINTISNFIKPTTVCWELLLSLDLSFNNLENVFQTVDFLKQLPKLRNLHLIGNPLHLFIGYRGYIIDSIKTLSFLDEVTISAHERHLSKGMSRFNKLPTSDICMINLKIDHFKGFLKSEEISAEDLKTFVKYHIEISFMKDCKVTDADVLDSEEVNEASDIDDENTKICISESNDIDDINNPNNIVIKSGEFNFNEDLDYKFNKYIFFTEMKQFADFLSNKLEIRIIQNSIIMSNKPIESEHVSTITIKELDPVESARKRPRKDSAKSAKSATKLAKPKKLKVNVDDLHELSRTKELFASIDIDCQSIANGSFIIEKDCLLIPLNVPESIPEPEIVNITNSDRGKKKMGKSPPKIETNGRTKTNVMKTGKVETIMEEPDGEGNHDMLQEVIELPSMLFSMEVIHWNTAKDGSDWIEKFSSIVS